MCTYSDANRVPPRRSDGEPPTWSPQARRLGSVCDSAQSTKRPHTRRLGESTVQLWVRTRAANLE